MKKIVFAGSIAVFIIFFIFMFVSEKLLSVSDKLERGCTIELYTKENDFGIKQTGCQATVLMVKTISLLFIMLIIAAIGGIGFIMFKHYM